jgi:hypothetical protein
MALFLKRTLLRHGKKHGTHEGGTKKNSTYFVRICQETGDKTHSITQQNVLQNVQVLDSKMEQISMEFDQAKENLNIYAFVEGQPINKDEVTFQYNDLQ